MIDKQLIISTVEEKLKGTNYFLIDVSVTPDNVISVEIDSDDFVYIDDCADVSRYIEAHLDRDKEDYELEVGSAGITAPFKHFRQYVKNIGKEVEMELKTGVKLTGILKNADADGAVLTVPKKVKTEGSRRKTVVNEDVTFNYNEIKQTKYLIRF
ncbi:MAG: ribosome assembly cofactor RimP [Tannerella sp.]|jgi:ribosome maturation factor RimP|nr:ribosome assembly cofactor RimP [Tannerella sp.]